MTMRNKFAGTCRRCQLLVPAGEGLLLKDERDRWVVQCDAAGGPLCPVQAAAPRQVPPRPTTNVGELAGVLALFAKARGHLKAPAIELGVPGHPAIRINVAGERARVPGSITVLSSERFDAGREFPERKYLGRICDDGTFEPGRDLRAEPAWMRAATERLRAFAADPSKVGGEDGLLHGRCCFCRKALSDERSTAVGYGKTCSQNWGLKWGARPAEFAASAA